MGRNSGVHALRAEEPGLGFPPLTCEKRRGMLVRNVDGATKNPLQKRKGDEGKAVSGQFVSGNMYIVSP